MTNRQAHMISNGDVFSIRSDDRVDNYLFENGLYYKVIEEEIYFNEKATIKHYRRTGLVLTAEDINLL